VFRWITTRRLLIGGCFLAALVTVFTSVPVGTSPPGSPGTDPYAGSVNFESVAGALGVPAPVLLLVWLVLIGMIWRSPHRQGIVAGVAGLAVALAMALGCGFVAVRAAWLSLTAYDAPQVAEAAHHLWRLGAAGVTAAAAGVLVSMRPDRVPHVIGPMASGFVLAGIALFLLLGTGPPATIGQAVAIGLGALGSVAVVAVAVAPLWRSGVSSRRVRWRRVVSLAVAGLGAVMTARWIFYGAFTIFSCGIHPISAFAGPLLFGVHALVAAATARELTTDVTTTPLQAEVGA
jgi:hypothetical protein